MQRFEYQNIGATEIILSNGMRVCYKCTDFLDDQVQQHQIYCGFYGLLVHVTYYS